MLGAARGHRVRLCVPANVTPERKRILHAYGADLVFTDPMDGSDGAILEARRIYAAAPDRYFYADQYSNDANWRAHYDTTAVEILEQTGGRVTHFVAGLGTSGTFVGTGRRLREIDRSIRAARRSSQTRRLHDLEGLKHMASAIVPPIYDPSLADRQITVATEDAHELTRRLAREAGLFVGPSSGAALAACLDAAAGRPCRRLRHHLSRRRRSLPVGSLLGRDGRIAAVVRQRRADLVCGEGDDSGRRRTQLSGRVLRRAARADARATSSKRCRSDNITTGERRRRFLIGPDEYRAAEQHADDTGRALLGFYHSHPDHPAEPSAFDLEHAWPNLSYVIVSVAAAGPASCDRGGFAPTGRATTKSRSTGAQDRNPSCPFVF